MAIRERLQSAWNAFMNKDPTPSYRKDVGMASSFRPDRLRLSRGNERTIVTAPLNRMAIDCASISIKHVRIDQNERYKETINSGLNNCLTLDANVDQTGRAFIQDAVMSMFDEGVVALVPVETDDDIIHSTFDVLTLRTAKIVEWYPKDVKLRVYNQDTGKYENVVLPKASVAIIENPLYVIMNEHNSTLQRLIRKLSLLDIADEQAGAGKLDLIIQLPYTIKTEARRRQANERKQDIVNQLTGSKYGIAYTDASEHITQLNRSVDNQLQLQVEYLTSMLYSQLGITTAILDGTADEQTMLNYISRTVEPILSAFADEMKRKFLSKTARTQGQSIMFFKDPFKLVPVSQLAEITDKMTRNEVMTSNEVRQIIGLKPSNDPKADELRNKNLNQSAEAMAEEETLPLEEEDYDSQMEALEENDRELDDMENMMRGL